MKTLFRWPVLLFVLCLMLLTATDAFAFGRCRGGGCGGGRPRLFHGFFFHRAPAGGCASGSCGATYYFPAAPACPGGTCGTPIGMCHPAYNVAPGYFSHPTHPQYLLPPGGCCPGGGCR